MPTVQENVLQIIGLTCGGTERTNSKNVYEIFNSKVNPNLHTMVLEENGGSKNLEINMMILYCTIV